MAYISTAEVREIRNELKHRFNNSLKFSVKNDRNSKVYITIKSGTIDFSDIMEEKPYIGINQYNTSQYGKHSKLLNEIFDIIKTAPGNIPGGRVWYNNSDSMTDYFDTAFYFDLRIGDYDKPYEFKGKKTTQKISKTDINPSDFNFISLSPLDDSNNDILSHIRETHLANEIYKNNHTLSITQYSREIAEMLEASSINYAVTENPYKGDLNIHHIEIGEYQIVIDTRDLNIVLRLMQENKKSIYKDDVTPPEPEDFHLFI